MAIESSEVKQELEGKINHLAMEVSLLREEIRTTVSSRRGVPGGQGPKGDSGPAGRDAQIRIVQDGQTIRIVDGDRVAAEIVAVPGPKGDTGAVSTVAGPQGLKGDPGVSPSLDEIVAAVVKAISSRLS